MSLNSFGQMDNKRKGLNSFGQMNNKRVGLNSFGQMDNKRKGSNSFGQTVKNTMVEYVMNSTLSGIKNLVEPERDVIERVIWFGVVALSLVGMLYAVYQTCVMFVTHPTMVFLESSQYPIIKTPFPGVAICDNNKISRRKAMEYADFLNEGNSTTDDFLNQLRYLGRNIDHIIEEQSEFLNFMEDLFSLDMDQSGVYNTRGRMEMLSPSCEDMLVSCKWKTKEADCQKLFVPFDTPEGRCCAFKDMTEEDVEEEENDEDNGEDADHDENAVLPIGEENGITVVLDPHLDDYFYTTRPSEGFNVLIYPAESFPDHATGVILQSFASVGMSVMLEMDTVTTYSVPAVRQFTIEQRGCRFEDELTNGLKGLYSYNKCLVHCKIKTIIEVCHCVPYFMPWEDPDIPCCSLFDVPCLYTYRLKFRFLSPSPDEDTKGLEEELWNSFHCPDCLPDCEGTDFDVHVSSMPLEEGFNDRVNSSNYTEIRIFYGNMHSELYKMGVKFTWLEVVGNIGGLCSIFIGLSLISVVELIYYCTIRLFIVHREQRQIFDQH